MTHLALASFVALHAYPITQDGPAHLYAAHILGELAKNPASIYQGVFVPNLHPVANSLFTYLTLAVERYAPIEWAVSIAIWVALLGMPLSLVAFESALRAQASPTARARLSDGPAPALACVLAYNYFLYRGLFNYALSVPFALASLAAVVALGRRQLEWFRIFGLAFAALACASLAALAHPAASVFLVTAVSLACLSPGHARRVTGALVAGLLITFLVAGRISNGAPAHPVFMSLLTALQAFVRALGITQTWLEVVPAVLLLALASYGARRALFPLSRIISDWSVLWPAVLAVGMALGYFVLPFEYGGVAGLNERIPIFSVLLLLPYARLPARAEPWLPVAFGIFALYTAFERTHLDRMASEVRDSAAANLIPRGSSVYAASLRVKMGAISADLGRHVLADVIRRRALVAGTVFCDHPAHVLKCTERVPAVAEVSAVQSFEHLSPAHQNQALRDPQSPIRRAFAAMRDQAASSHYLLVVGASTLNAAFDRFVAAPLGAQLISNETEPVRVYESSAAP